jgi:hypothetical protein
VHDAGTAIGLLVLLLLFGACVGAGMISGSVWHAVASAVALVLVLAFVLFIIIRVINPTQDGDLIAGILILSLFKYVLPAAAVVAAVASIISNGGRLRRTQKDKD